MKKAAGPLRTVILLMLVFTLVFASACSNSNEGKPEATPSEASQTPSAPSASASPEEVIDPLGKFEPAIELTSARYTEGMTFDENRSIDNNQYYDAYRDQLGIQVKHDWVVNGWQDLINKTNIVIASGDISDLMIVTGPQLKSLVEADMIEDLTGVYDKYASEDTKRMMQEDGGIAMRASTFAGKLMALPVMASSIDSAGVLWIRDDWLTKLNLAPPQTIDDLVTVAKAFMDADPTGKTYGLGVSKELQYGGSPNIGNFLNAFHAYPGMWVKDDSGKLVFGSTLPEMKTGLVKLAELFKMGLIDKEFGVKEGGKVHEMIAAGKLGMFFGDMAAPLYANNGSKKNDPAAQWSAYAVPSADGQLVKVNMGGLSNWYHVIRKGYEHPEAAVKLLNFWIDKNYVNVDAPLSRNQETGVLYYPYALVTSNPALKNLNAHRSVRDALASGDESKMDQEAKFYYDKIKKWAKAQDDVADWSYDRIFGVGKSSFEVIDAYKSNGNLMMTEFLGGDTPAMVDRMATLDKMEKVMITKIIMGAAGAEEFDKFVSDWYKQGGETITQEVNKWYQLIQ